MTEFVTKTEINYDLNPLLSDSDADGISDWYEYNYGIIDSLAEDDDDNDGLSNLAEYLLGTDPTYEDSDYDGLLDATEVLRFGSNPANADEDNDAFNDPFELFVFGSDPSTLDSIFGIPSSGDVYGFGSTGWTVESAGYLRGILNSTGYYLGNAGRLSVNTIIILHINRFT